MRHLIQFVVPRISANWEEVAYALKFEIQSVLTIKGQYPTNFKKCCMEMFKEWLMSKDKGPITWSFLLETLREIEDLKAVTEEIERQLDNLQ